MAHCVCCSYCVGLPNTFSTALPSFHLHALLFLCDVCVCVSVWVLSGPSDSVWELTNHTTRREPREGSEAMRNTYPPLQHPQTPPTASAAVAHADALTHTFRLSHVLNTNRSIHTHTQTFAGFKRPLLFWWIYLQSLRSQGHGQPSWVWWRNSLVAWLCKWGKHNHCSFPRVKFPI